MYEVFSIEMGTRKTDASGFLHLVDPGKVIEIAYRFWVVRDVDKTFLIDCGPSTVGALKRGFPAMNDPLEMLNNANVAVQDVSTIILTHLHWDHADNLSLFPDADIVLQQCEVDFYRNGSLKHSAIRRHFGEKDISQRLDLASTLIVDGDHQFLPGIKLLHVGGHTPGLQMVCVDTAEGKVLVASDAVPLNRNYLDRIAPGILIDLPRALDGIDRAHEVGADWLMTGHDAVSRICIS